MDPSGKNSFWQSLFDFEFKEFITIRLAGLIYALAIALISLFTLIFIIDGFGISFWRGILNLIISPAIFLIAVTGTRVWLEITVVLFDIARDLSELRKTILKSQPNQTGDESEIPVNQEAKKS